MAFSRYCSKYHRVLSLRTDIHSLAVRKSIFQPLRVYKVESTDFKENRCSDVHWIEQPQETLHILHRDVFVKDEDYLASGLVSGTDQRSGFRDHCRSGRARTWLWRHKRVDRQPVFHLNLTVDLARSQLYRPRRYRIPSPPRIPSRRSFRTRRRISLAY